MALPHAKMPLSFESLCAILYTCVSARKSLAVSSSSLAALKSARADLKVQAAAEAGWCCRKRLRLNWTSGAWFGAAVSRRRTR